MRDERNAVIHPPSLRPHPLVQRWLRRRRSRTGLRSRRRVRVCSRRGARSRVGLLLVRGLDALAQSLDLRVGGGDRGFEVRVACGEQFELLLYARALAFELLLYGVAHSRGVERADERGAALYGVGLQLVINLREPLLILELLVGHFAQLRAKVFGALLGAREAFEVEHRALVGLQLVQLAGELFDLRREVAHGSAQLVVLGLRVLARSRVGAPLRPFPLLACG